jgi:hypothetical protein
LPSRPTQATGSAAATGESGEQVSRTDPEFVEHAGVLVGVDLVGQFVGDLVGLGVLPVAVKEGQDGVLVESYMGASFSVGCTLRSVDRAALTGVACQSSLCRPSVVMIG